MCEMSRKVNPTRCHSEPFTECLAMLRTVLDAEGQKKPSPCSREANLVAEGDRYDPKKQMDLEYTVRQRWAPGRKKSETGD